MCLGGCDDGSILFDDGASIENFSGMLVGDEQPAVGVREAAGYVDELTRDFGQVDRVIEASCAFCEHERDVHGSGSVEAETEGFSGPDEGLAFENVADVDFAEVICFPELMSSGEECVFTVCVEDGEISEGSDCFALWRSS